jgi:hypothetical protein
MLTENKCAKGQTSSSTTQDPARIGLTKKEKYQSAVGITLSAISYQMRSNNIPAASSAVQASL